MKKFTLMLVLAVFCTQFSLKAQTDVTINPIGILWGDISLGADFVLNDDFSVEGLLGFGTGSESDADFNSFNVTAAGKYYLNPNQGADKFYVMGFLRFVNRDYDYEDGSSFANYKQSRVGIGVGIGTKVVSVKGFVFDINLGAGRAFVDNTSFESNGEQVELDWPDIMFAGKLGIGYRFSK